jgi:hypothetical protein
MSDEKAVDRSLLWKRFGPPTEQIGSVNDPRTQEECGVKWNEKWLYRDPEGDGSDRVVLWNRYDLLGVFTLKPDGNVERESLAG